ncbi:hypothetical protein L6164_018241 [Bauhinia variegata]|uniref:Uncharacterized protein n=1 Tax=Bauhinia variegata TaxID=167791 RepID=A0ACB9NDZ8_BAUVA|nr:hypothetical protein L6164_018241 [Bauhinia variegata]
MEATLSFGFSFVALVVIVGMVARVLNLLWLKPKRLERFLREQGLKGNSYTPLFGDLKQMHVMTKAAESKPINIADDTLTRALPFHQFIVQKYGKNSFLWFGPTPVVNIMKPEQIKYVFNKNYDFPKPPISPLANFLLTGLSHQEGEKWAKHRKIVNPAFHLESLKLMLPAFYQCCEEMMDKWETLVSPDGSCELDVWPSFHNLTGDVISRTAFGSSYEEGKRIFQLQVELAKYTTVLVRSIYIPGWRFLPTKVNRRMKELQQEMHGLIREMIQKREKAKKAGEAPKDLLGSLLESNFRELQEHGNHNNVGLTTEEVINECKLFYFAGHETTSVLLNWTMVLLSRFPEWQARAREEVVQEFGTNKPDYDGLNRLKIVTMILYEVLRLYPPATVLQREVRKETKLGDLTLPAGTRIWIPTFLVHQDKELWGNDVKEFKPERFYEGVLKATKGQVSYLPFGWGPRICIGQNFSLIEAKMALSLILQRFSFELSSSYAHAPHLVLTLQPQFGTHIILHKL